MMGCLGIENVARLSALLATLLVAGCGSVGTPITGFADATDKQSSLSVTASRAAELILSDDPGLALAQTNLALQTNPNNSYLHYLNALAYHAQARAGDGTRYALAQKGYSQAVRFDAGNTLALYGLGELYFEQRKFRLARDQFSEVLLYNPKDPDSTYALAVSAYLSMDVETAAGAIRQLAMLEPDSRRLQQAASLIFAAAGEHQLAQQFVQQLATAPHADNIAATRSQGLADRVRQRVLDWSNYYASEANMVAPRSQPVEARFVDVALADAEENLPNEEMVVVDVVIIRTEEDVTTSKGVNILSGLMVQLGSFDTDNENAYTYTNIDEKEQGNRTRTITRSLTVPSINYSLNIANAGNARNEILARPTLIAYDGKSSEFFSGVEVNAAAVSNSSSGDSVEIEKEVGVRLKLEPEILSDGRIRLDIEAERTFLKTPSSSVEFSLRVETSKTNVSASVIMDFEDTLILSGMSEKETERTRDGVPVLQDVPGLQYFFSRATTRDFQKSVLILVTPRRPQYVYQKTRAAGNAESDRPLDELKARYADWFKPYPNWSSVFHHMQDNQLYRQFRTGDVSLDTSNDYQQLSGRLSQALQFLYY
ncbi:hypothetical protein GH975_06135 [Litorivicinus lipolyticus]|uniref:Type II/III secretion system secretin-like domain-containing protein n=2 Tax=Litorivicinus lipolyticus TaxID=418701 RepID=A0A5Q2QGN7_9GAMM|nr:hypothetical protein GH975_06135 [Litorivicinus lipolyticus]